MEFASNTEKDVPKETKDTKEMFITLHDTDIRNLPVVDIGNKKLITNTISWVKNIKDTKQQYYSNPEIIEDSDISHLF